MIILAMANSNFHKLIFPSKSDEEILTASLSFYHAQKSRRSVRHYSDKSVARNVLENAIRAAGSAPSGANMQPWHFVAVSCPELKTKIRVAAEEEERAFYEHRASKEWLDALAPLETDDQKPFLEIAPWLVVIFLKKFSQDTKGNRLKNYYTSESVGIATGFLITALHSAGLATLVHTPSPMKFLNELCSRPSDERPFLILIVGHPAADAMVPTLEKKPLAEIATFI
jgi:iodotyrosine deiodinase